MSYAIAKVIYGIPLTRAAGELINRWEEDEDSPWIETTHGLCGFTSLYSAGGDGPIGYCGIDLGEFSEFETYITIKLPNDEGNHELQIRPDRGNVRRIPLSISQIEKDQAQREINNVHQELWELCPEPGFFIVFSSS